MFGGDSLGILCTVTVKLSPEYAEQPDWSQALTRKECVEPTAAPLTE